MESKKGSSYSKEFINLEEIIASRNAKLLKLIPGFILNYLKRVVHEKELNASMSKNSDKIGLDFVNAILKEFQANIIVKGEENIPSTGKYIIISNHPLGGLDGLALINIVGKKRKDIKFIVNNFLLNIKNLDQLFIPVNKCGRTPKEVLKMLEKIYSSDNTILTFPAGLCSRKNRGKIVDLEWQKSFITQAKKHHRDIIPAYIDGRNSNFFYNLANLRKFLRIKTNIEMLYLVDEMYKQKNKTINIIFDKPISYNTFNNTMKDKEWAEKIKGNIYDLGKKNNLLF